MNFKLSTTIILVARSCFLKKSASSFFTVLFLISKPFFLLDHSKPRRSWFSNITVLGSQVLGVQLLLITVPVTFTLGAPSPVLCFFYCQFIFGVFLSENPRPVWREHPSRAALLHGGQPTAMALRPFKSSSLQDQNSAHNNPMALVTSVTVLTSALRAQKWW